MRILILNKKKIKMKKLIKIYKMILMNIKFMIKKEKLSMRKQ